MIFIDYPPGGLGNFLAQCLTNTVDFEYKKLSFHNSKNASYDRLSLNDRTHFIEAFPKHKFTKKIAVIHSFGELNLVKQCYPDSKIIQVVVKKEIAIFLNNLYRKAAADNINSPYLLEKHLIENFGSLSQAVKRENYALSYMHWLNTQSYHNTIHKHSDIIINFDSLYQDKDSFKREIIKLTTKNIDKIYKAFTDTQQVIIDKVNLYKDILNNHKEYSKCSGGFDVIDHGLLAGMLQIKYGREFFLPNQEEFECII